MNEKFFDLKKEKQDRMINAALKIFAKYGYRHASTDDIVVEAGISKGLLFHYFDSKLGLYTFLYDYCVRFMSLGFKSSVPEKETDYFNIMAGIEAAKFMTLSNYPYMQAFIDRSQSEEAEEAINATLQMRLELQNIYDSMLNQVDSTPFKSSVDPAQINSMLNYTFKGIMNEQLSASNFNAASYHTEAIRYIDTFKTLCY